MNLLLNDCNAEKDRFSIEQNQKLLISSRLSETCVEGDNKEEKKEARLLDH